MSAGTSIGDGRRHRQRQRRYAAPSLRDPSRWRRGGEPVPDRAGALLACPTHAPTGSLPSVERIRQLLDPDISRRRSKRAPLDDLRAMRAECAEFELTRVVLPAARPGTHRDPRRGARPPRRAVGASKSSSPTSRGSSARSRTRVRGSTRGSRARRRHSIELHWPDGRRGTRWPTRRSRTFPALDDDELAPTIDGLREFERELSDVRHELHACIDALDREIAEPAGRRDTRDEHRDALETRLRDLGEFIRDQRRNARLSLRKLSEAAGISNPYLSQIERGLRKPSAEILQAIAKGLRISAETLYVRAGHPRRANRRRARPRRRGRSRSDADRPPEAGLVEIYRSFQTETRGGASEAATGT